MSKESMKRFVILAVISFLLIISSVSAADYRNAYVIMWDGTPCDNVAYAKSMGYDYVGYQQGMQDCTESNDLYFYIESPDQDLQIRGDFIYFDKTYTSTEKKTYNDLLLWKSNTSFPNNLATGWFFTSNFFRPLADFQQQKVIDLMVSRALESVKNAEDPSKNFLFGGWSWDVPQLEGDLWTGVQGLPLQNRTGTGGGVNISYWTKSCSGIKHPGLTQEYACYRDGKAAYYKKLFSETRKQYPNMKVYMEPYTPWASYIKEISSRTDATQLKPDILCEEKGALDFVTDSRVFATGLMTKDKMCCDSSEVYDHKGNLVIAGNAGVNGAWYLWYGRFGGVGNFAPLDSIRQVPDRLKLIKAMPGWDNLNSVPLSKRSWDATKSQYNSTLSYADLNVIYSTHPKNKKIYFVVLNKANGIYLQGKSIDKVYSTDELFRQKTDVTSDFTQSNGYLYLKLDSSVGKGYILTLKDGSSPPPIIPSAPCTDSDDGNSTFTKGVVTYKANNKTYTYNDTCLSTTRIREYYCSNDKPKDGNYTCKNGCTNSACIPDAPSPTCKDSDGGNSTFTKGTVTYIANYKTYTYNDTCFKAGNISRVREYYCLNNNYKDANFTCKNGCTNSACIPDTPVEPPSEPPEEDTEPRSSGGSSSPSITGDAIGQYCGDHICTPGKEECIMCSVDCGVCPQPSPQIIRHNNNNATISQEILKAVDTGLERTNELTGLIIKEEIPADKPADTVFMMAFMVMAGGLVFFTIRRSLSL